MSTLLALAVSTIAAQTVTMDATQITIVHSAQKRLPAEVDLITLTLSANDPREWEGAIAVVEEAERRVRKVLEKEDPKATITPLSLSSVATPPNGGSSSQQLELRLTARSHTQPLAARLATIKGVTSVAITHDVLDRAKTLSDARREAVAGARAKAEDYCAAAGRKLGKVQSLIENNEGIQAPYQSTWITVSTTLTLKLSLE